MVKRLDRARKKAEVLTENQDLSSTEKNKEMKNIYRKAGLLNKKKVEVKYIVGRKGAKSGKGIKGPYRVVDRRLKKDKKHAKDLNKNSKKKGKKTNSKKGKTTNSKK